MKGFLIVFLAFLCSAVHLVHAKTERVVCYLGSWAHYRNGNGKFEVEDIDTSLCTHVIYTFLGINTDGTLKILDSYLELDLKNLERFNNLKKKNSNLKTMIAVGGWNEGSTKYSNVAASPTKRATMIKSAVDFLEKYNLDGFDVDWEYPSQRGGSSSDKANYVQLLKEFREAFDKKGFILTAAVAAAASSVDLSYDVPALSKYLDSINVMAYDLHGSYDGVTGANAPLYSSSVDVTDYAKSLTVDASIRGWIKRGADPQKISMGIPTYGRSFTLSDSSSNGMGARASYAGNQGPYTQESGMLGYLEICENQKQGGWITVWDNNTKTPYTYKGNQWVGYDNEESIKLKVDYAKAMNLGGIMVWSLESTDHKGICGKKYPLLSVIKNALNYNSGDAKPDIPQPGNDKPADDKSADNKPADSKPGDNETNESNSSEDGNSKDSNSKSNESSENGASEEQNDTICKEFGLVRDSEDCSAFYSCVPGILKSKTVRFQCGNSLAFDNTIKTCNYKSLVDCTN